MMRRRAMVAAAGSFVLALAGCGGRSLLNGAPEGQGTTRDDAGAPHEAGLMSILDTGTGEFEGGPVEAGAEDVLVAKEASLFDAPTEVGIVSLPLDAGPYPATFPTAPQVVNLGGQPLANPKIVAIMFSNDDPTTVADITAFFTGIGASSYWLGLSEYNVGAASPAQIIPLMEASPTSIDDSAQQGETSALQNWLITEISNGAVPAPDANTEYMVVYPSSTTITADGTTLCGQSGVGGYHSDFLGEISGQMTPVAYGVLPRCAAMDGLTELQIFTGASSHEIIEAATDPFPNINPAWAQDDNAHLFWDEADSGSEIGDMCEIQPEAFFQFSDFPFVVQRYWSNAAARAGTDPCVPEYPGEVFFNAVPELPDNVTFPMQGGNITVISKKIAVGASATIDLDLYSEGPTTPWTVTVQDFNQLQTGDPSQALLGITMSQTEGENGTKLPVTITVNSAGNENTNGQINDTELFLIESTQGTGQNQIVNLWWGFVSN